MSTTRTALVTGASAGIGAAFSRHLAAEGYNLLLVARRTEKLQDLARELVAQHEVNVSVFAADLSKPSAPAAIIRYAETHNIDIDILINNAGLSGKSAFATTPWASLAGEIQLMVTACTELCHRVVPKMQERGWGRIINVSSIAALSPPAASLLYTGIKSYVLNISQSMDMELKPHGIHVTALCPGFTHSEFHSAMGTQDQADQLPDFLWQEPEEVVRESWAALMKGKPVCIPGNVNKLIVSCIRPLPISLQYQFGRLLNPFKQ